MSGSLKTAAGRAFFRARCCALRADCATICQQCSQDVPPRRSDWLLELTWPGAIASSTPSRTCSTVHARVSPRCSSRRRRDRQDHRRPRGAPNGRSARLSRARLSPERAAEESMSMAAVGDLLDRVRYPLLRRRFLRPSGVPSTSSLLRVEAWHTTCRPACRRGRSAHPRRRALAAERPVLIAIDDVHWLDHVLRRRLWRSSYAASTPQPRRAPRHPEDVRAGGSSTSTPSYRPTGS